jgi:O-antigen ligase
VHLKLPYDNVDRFALAVAALGTTLLALPWTQDRLATAFLFEAIVAAVGVPLLLVLAWGALAPTKAPSTHAARDEHKRRVRRTAQLAAAFAIWALVSTAVSPQPALSFFGRLGIANGALLVLAFVGAWAIGAVVAPTSRELLELTLIGAAVLNAVVAIVQTATSLGDYDRAPGLFTNPLFAATLMTGAFWPTLHRLSDNWKVWGAVAVVLAGGVQATGSRFGLLLLGVQLVAALAIVSWRRLAGLAAVLAILVIAALLLGPSDARTIGTSRILLAQGSEPISRVELWKASGQAIADRPVVGAGPSRLLAATNPYRSLEAAQAGEADTNFLDAHNIVVEYTVTTGVIGGALVIAFLVSALMLSGWRAPLAGFAIVGLVMTLIQPVHAMMTPITLMALGAASAHTSRLAVRRPRRAIAATATAAVVASAAIAYGSFALSSTPSSFDQVSEVAETSRRFLPIWHDAFAETATATWTVASQSPEAGAATVYWREQAVRKEPDRFALWTQLAFDEAALGDVESAERHFLRSLEENRWSLQTLNGLGELYVDLGRVDDARWAYKRSLLVQPDQPDVQAALDRLD